MTRLAGEFLAVRQVRGMQLLWPYARLQSDLLQWIPCWARFERSLRSRSRGLSGHFFGKGCVMQMRRFGLADCGAVAFDPGVRCKLFAIFTNADAELCRYALPRQQPPERK